MNAQPKAAIELLIQLKEELLNIFKNVKHESDLDVAWEHLRRWKVRAVKKLCENISPREGELLNRKSGAAVFGEPYENLYNAVQAYESFFVALEKEIRTHPDDVLLGKDQTPVQPTEEQRDSGKNNTAIFIVHGHDEVNLYKLKELVRERFRLEAIVLSSEPGKGRTLIEKFEEEANRAAFAFVLLTPDDKIQKKDTDYLQARPNVIFELGWFYARLGRNNVSLLIKKGTIIHSDLNGISRIEFSNSIEEKVIEIEKELTAKNLISKNHS